MCRFYRSRGWSSRVCSGGTIDAAKGIDAQPRDDTVTITEFSMDDYAVVHVLWQRGDLWMRPSDGPEATRLKLTRDPELFLVARSADGRVVGTVMGGWDGRRAYVYHLAVAPERRREGIADALMDELEERFRKLGALKAKLQILVENETSKAYLRAPRVPARDRLRAVGQGARGGRRAALQVMSPGPPRAGGEARLSRAAAAA